MHYPGFPDNRLIVDGVDLTYEFKLVLVDGYVLEPPEPKTYKVDIPGGNGSLDLTDAIYGDVAYENRKQSFTFYVIAPDNFEYVKTKVSNFLHGKEADYQITMDPSYTYHGRFTVTGYEHKMYELGVVGTINVSVSAEPYKFKQPIVTSLNAIGGIYVSLESGHKKVRPIFEVWHPCKVIFNDKVYKLYQGTWTIHDIVFKEGENRIYFNNYEMRNLTWGDLNTQGITWGRLKLKRIFEWYRSNGSNMVPIKTWNDTAEDTWQQHMDNNETWDDQLYDAEHVKSLKPVYVKYEWGDL